MIENKGKERRREVRIKLSREYMKDKKRGRE